MSGRVVLVTAVGAARGSRAAAAALACAGSREDRPGLLIDVDGAAPRPALVASVGARVLEERLAAHLPGARAASRGQTCHLALPAGEAAIDGIRAALPLVHGSVAALHVPQNAARTVIADFGLELGASLLRADLATDRALTALIAADLIAAGLAVRVLKRRLSWIAERRALFGILPLAASEGLPARLLAGLLDVSSKPARRRS